MTEKERQDTKMATLYELRLIFTNGEKKEYTTEEIVELLDKLAMAKEQEAWNHVYTKTAGGSLKSDGCFYVISP